MTGETDPFFGNQYTVETFPARQKTIINAQTGETVAIEDRYGNRVDFSFNGIKSNRGRQLTFERDWRGNVTAITDPAGYQLRYEYDAAGRLSGFYDRRASQKLDDGLTVEPTRFSYRNSADEYANFLSSITDPAGVVALSAIYNPNTGRLEKLTDADGHSADLIHNTTNLTVTSSSESGTTEVDLDSFGNPIREVDEAGQETLYSYAGGNAALGLPGTVTQVIGAVDTQAEIDAGTGDDLVTERTYNEHGQRTTETDPRGNVSKTFYRSGYPYKEEDVHGNATTYGFYGGQLYSTRDADFNSTGFDYDSFGSVSTVSQSNFEAGTSSSTSFDYNAFGDLTETVDPDGNVRSISYDQLGNQIGTSSTWTDPGDSSVTETLTTAVGVGPDGQVDWTLDAAGNASATLYDALGRAYIQISDAELTAPDSEGRRSYIAGTGRETVSTFDKRGLSIETRTESVDELGQTVYLVSRTTYDEAGRAVYSTDSFPEAYFIDTVPDDTPASEVTGTKTVYNPTTGQVDRTEQLVGLEIDLLGIAPNQSAELVGTPTVVSFSSTIYIDGRVTESTDSHLRKTETLYDQFGSVVETRTESFPDDGSGAVWLVSRTIYDSLGRVSLSTDHYAVPHSTPLGEDPAGGAPETQVTKTVYDDRGRTIATERYADTVVSLSQQAGLAYSPQPVLSDAGTLESVSETLYDSVGRAWRTISGRVPMSTLSGTALAQAEALANYPTHGGEIDRYENLPSPASGLSPGQISDTLFDARGRQYGSLGHPLPAADVGLSGASYDGNLVRLRSETVYNSYGQASIQRSGLAHVVNSDGTFVGVFDEQSVDIQPSYDAFGNVVRSETIIGGTILPPLPLGEGWGEGPSRRENGQLHSFTLTEFDDENRPIAEMQQTEGAVDAAYNAAQETFVVTGILDASKTSYSLGDSVPTKLYRYDADDRLVAVELPAVANPLSSNTIERPRYEYGYDERGNQTLVVDPRGRQTRFGFNGQGQQETRTLPLGFGPDGKLGTADDATLPEGDFKESFQYDDRGRQILHVSFEDVVTETIYDTYGRIDEQRYFESKAAFDDPNIGPNETWQFTYDAFGRRTKVERFDSAGVLLRTDATSYDSRGRVISESSPEGVLGYGYDAAGRMTHAAVYAAGADPSVAPPERVTRYGYDLLGRLVSVQEDATPADTADDPQTATDYTFDLSGRMDTQTTAAGAQSVTTDYDYDPLGRLDLQTDRDESGNTLARYDYTVRADGKRTGLKESFWLTDDDNDGIAETTDGDGIQQEAELDKTTYDWNYDAVGRLTDEVLDHWDDQFDQSESFAYDLTGNRMELTRDKGNDSSVDEVITYGYDANDRLLEEVLDDLTVANDDTTTSYVYDHTQQTSKTVVSTSSLATRSSQLFSYNLQGRMSSVVNEGYTSGALSSRERTSYEYDSSSFRVELINELDANLDESYTLASRTSFLASHNTHTGYTQTIRETTYDENGVKVKTVDYTFGHDEISQTVTGFNPDGTVVSTTVHVFGHDGHGSVRVLYDLASTTERIAQAFTFAAYGQLLAVHGPDGLAVPVTAAMTSLGYSGEYFDAKAQQQYLRARWYDPANGRFNRLDDFAGNMQDPQSLHKYAYLHGDPVNHVDPNGEFLVTTGFIIGGFYAGNIQANKASADLATKTTTMGVLHVYARMAAWRLGGMLGGLALSAFVPRLQGYLRVSSDDEDYAAHLPVPAATNERSVNNRIAIDAATTAVNRQRMVTVLQTVRNTQRHSFGIDTCFHCREKIANRIRALGTPYYDNSEYVIKRIQWSITPTVVGWEDHFGLVIISKATGQRVAYIDNGSFGDSSGTWPAQVGGLFTTVPETFFRSTVSQEGELIDLDQ